MARPFINEELKVQLPAIDWLKEHWGYQEVKSAEDDDAWGAPIDSVGLMNGRVLLIEVKVKVSGGDVRHNPNRSGYSIEGKFARTLTGLLNNATKYNLSVIQKIWDRSHPLVFVLLAKTYTDGGFEEAKDVFGRRAPEWLFDYRIWHWDGAGVRNKFAKPLIPSPSAERYGELRIPALTEHSKRSRVPSLEEQRGTAERRTLLHIFDYAVQRARQLGYEINITKGGITLVAGVRTAKRDTSIGIFLDKSSAHSGLIFNFTSERSDVQWDQLPGRLAPKVGVYSTEYRYIRTIDEVEIALRIFAP